MIGKQFDRALEVDPVGPLQRADAVAIVFGVATIAVDASSFLEISERSEPINTTTAWAGMVLPVENFGGDAAHGRENLAPTASSGGFDCRNVRAHAPGLLNPGPGKAFFGRLDLLSALGGVTWRRRG
jgi:hypothetical protein